MKWTVSQLVPLVAPVPHETLRYLVASRTRRGRRWLVDLGAYCGHGRCMCEHFSTKINPFLRSGEQPDEYLECWHITQARRYLAIEVAQTIIAQRQAAADANRKDNGKKPVRYDQEAPTS